MRGIFLTLSLVAAVSASAQSLTTVISSYKVRPEETPPLKTTAELHAARNEFEAFQLVVLGGGSGLTQVRATAPTLTLQGTPQSLPSSAVHLYRLATVHATFPSALDGAPGEWPDALIPDVEDGPAAALVSGTWREVDSIGETRAAFPFDVAPNRNGLIWVEVQVPINATAGDYTGSITVRGWSGVVPFKQSVSVLLRVRPFTLPSTSRFPSMFLMSVDQVCSAHGDGDVNHFCLSVPDERVWGRLYARFFLDHRISVGIPDSPDTSNWPGTFATFDNSYGALISGTDPFSRLPGAALTTVRYPWWQYGSTDPAVQLPRLQQWVAYTKSKGVFNRTLDYSGDEPGINGRTWSDALNRAGWVHSADPAFRVMFATYIDTYNANAGPLSNACNIITPLLDQLDGPPGTRIAGNQRDLTAGDRYGVFRGLKRLNQVWGYQSCNEHGCGSSTLPQAVNFPSFMTDASGVQNRAEPWLHFIYRLAGIHYYDTVAHLTTRATD